MTTVYQYPLTVLEAHLDMLGHMNHATYLTILEEARWDLLTQKGFGLENIMKTGIAPTILEAHVRYLREIRLREQIIIETQPATFKGKLGYISQKILRGSDVCCTAEYTFGIFDLSVRKLIEPPLEWRKALGIDA